MTANELAEALGLDRLTPELAEEGERDVAGGFVSDMLSDALANAPRGGVWVTTQTHLNVVAVSAHAELAAVVFAAGRRPEEPVRSRAVAERVPLYVANAPAFDLVGRMYALGLRGEET